MPSLIPSSRSMGRGLVMLLVLAAPGLALAVPTPYGGPDSYGYYYADSTVSGGPTYDSTIFTTAVTSGTELTTADAADDTSQAVTLPFSFSFYGTSYSTVYACSNGYVGFTSTCSLSNAALSSSSYAMIAGFWDDLDNRGTGTSYMYYYTSGSSPDRVFNIVWVDVTHYSYTSGYGNISFAVQLKETTNDIVIQHKDVTFEGTSGSSYSAGLSATVGIDGGSTSGYYQQYSYNTAQLTGSSAIAFTTHASVTAEANGPYTADEGSTATISASGSTTADVTYAYDCTNDGTYEVTGSTSDTYDCTYSDDGSYTAKVKVTNSVYGSTASDTATVTVANVAPEVSGWSFDSGYYAYAYGTSGTYATVTLYAYEGDVQSVTSTATDVAADTVTISNDWGDGTVSTTSSATADTHAYEDDGVYTFSTTADDEDGGSSSFTDATNYLIYYWIDNVAPSIDIAAVTAGDEGTATAFAASVSDPGAGDTLTYLWNFGDGDSSSSASVSHQYADEGTYTWELTVTDDDGGSAVELGTTVVSDIAPTISSASLGGAVEGSAASFSATAAAGLSDTLTYSWDFGDGSTGSGASTTHTYADDGSYTVTLTVTDDDGSTGTYSGTSTITNEAPVISSLTVGTAVEGSALSVSVAATDPGSESLSYFWTFGDGSTDTTSTASTTHTYVDDGSYSVTVLVMDGDGGTDSETGTAVVSNANPVFTSTSIPSTGVEGSSVSGAAAATDAGTTDTITYTWDWGDGTTSSGASASHTYDDDGVFLVQVTAADADGGSTTTSGYATISGVAPVIGGYSSPASTDEGTATPFSATASDVAASDTLTYAWDWDDGSSDTGDAVSHAWADNGTYSVTLTVTDDDGLSDSEVFVVVVSNVAPTASAIAVLAADEGVSQTLSVTVVDPGTGDTFTYDWDFDDGDTATDAAPAHAWPDEGTYTVKVTVTDDDGDSSTATTTVDIANAAPVITSSPTTTAEESVAWAYAPSATDVAADTLTWSLSAAPAGMTVDASSGTLDWTPTWADANAPVAVTLDVADPDGGVGSQSFEIVVTAVDSDADGMPDGYEDAYGLDKADPADATADADSDGISNGDEWLDGTDPTGFDGPTEPILVSPIGGEYTASQNPYLTFADATSPRGDELSYDVEVYADAALTTRVTTTTSIPDVDGDQTVQVDTDILLTDNTIYYWHARANDSLVAGPWSATESFYVNTAEDAPSTPVLFQPIGGEITTSLTPDLIWTTSLDPDGTVVTYDVEVWDEAGTTLITAVSGVTDDTLDAYGDWVVDTSLDEDTVYNWTARAVDAAGTTSPWAVSESFFVSSANAAPTDVVWVAPVDAAVLTELAPMLEWSASSDAEGTVVSYRVEGDVDPGFTAPFGEDVAGTTLDLAAAGESLTENTTNYLRVRAEDADGVASNWAVISVFVRGANDAPSAPTLLTPGDGDEVTDTTPTLTFGEATDPDGDVLTYEVLVSKSADLSSPIASGPLSVAAGQGTWDVESALDAGTWYWTVVATDPEGAATAAAAWSFALTDGQTGDTGDGSTEDCGCNGSAGATAGLVSLVGFVLTLRRRRH